jgi:type II secretory pathway component GspD/PulD (secretin)
VRALVSPEGKFSLDRRSGVLEITDYPERLDRVALYLESIERRLHRQVELQARLVEVTLHDSSATGLNWDAALQKARIGAGSMNFDLFVSALAEQGTVRVLASPRVYALHNEPALVRLANGAGTEFTLAVTPHISADGTVMLALSRSSSQPAAEVPVTNTGTEKGNRKTRALATDEMTTAVRVRDGDTVILPGLLRERASQPASQSRGLAGLFGRERSAQMVKSEAAVLVTSRVVLSGGL